MNILFLSCHSVLEFLEVKLFTNMGYNVLSYGAYTSSNIGSGLRGEIHNLYKDQHLTEMALQTSQSNIHPEILAWADVVIMMHNARMHGEPPQPWLATNWDKLKKSKKPIIWRSIGQSTQIVEEFLTKYRKEGLKIIRYSPKEKNIPDFAGEDAIIRFYIDPAEYSQYEGGVPRIVNISQALFGNKNSGGNVASRGDHMNIKEFKAVVEGLDWKVFGLDNEDALEHNGGTLSYEDLKQMLKFNRVYFYTGTRPASYTLGFTEAFVAGIPIVSIGPNLGDSIYKDQKTFEVHELIGESGKAGFWSDDVNELREYCKLLLGDQELAKKIGEAGRNKAIQYFGVDSIQREWESFFQTL